MKNLIEQVKELKKLTGGSILDDIFGRKKETSKETPDNICHRCGNKITIKPVFGTDKDGNDFDYEGEYGHSEDCNLIKKYD